MCWAQAQASKIIVGTGRGKGGGSKGEFSSQKHGVHCSV